MHLVYIFSLPTHFHFPLHIFMNFLLLFLRFVWIHYVDSAYNLQSVDERIHTIQYNKNKNWQETQKGDVWLCICVLSNTSFVNSGHRHGHGRVGSHDCVLLYAYTVIRMKAGETKTNCESDISLHYLTFLEWLIENPIRNMYKWSPQPIYMCGQFVINLVFFFFFPLHAINVYLCLPKSNLYMLYTKRWCFALIWGVQ